VQTLEKKERRKLKRF